MAVGAQVLLPAGTGYGAGDDAGADDHAAELLTGAAELAGAELQAAGELQADWAAAVLQVVGAALLPQAPVSEPQDPVTIVSTMAVAEELRKAYLLGGRVGRVLASLQEQCQRRRGQTRSRNAC